ncbi:Nuclear transcription factor Y subunit B-8 [Ranunculus cassubicifolius]
MAEAPGSPAGGSHESGGDQSPRSNVREQDRYLPIANISRIMKKALPANGKIAKDAKETVLECVSEFISFITSEASDKCQREKRKTINGDDLLWAMATLGFEDYIDPLKVYLNRYREVYVLTLVSIMFVLRVFCIQSLTTHLFSLILGEILRLQMEVNKVILIFVYIL